MKRFLFAAVVTGSLPISNGLPRYNDLLHRDSVSAPTKLPLTGSEYRCKEYTYKSDECNTCTCEKCTDGKQQWDNGLCSCTASFCEHVWPRQPYDKKFWSDK